MSSSVGVPTRHLRRFAVAEGTSRRRGRSERRASSHFMRLLPDPPFKRDVNLGGRCVSARASTVTDDRDLECRVRRS